jgi:hypothetical protein
VKVVLQNVAISNGHHIDTEKSKIDDRFCRGQQEILETANRWQLQKPPRTRAPKTTGHVIGFSRYLCLLGIFKRFARA